MSFVRTPPVGEATGLAGEFYAEDLRQVGYVRNYTRVFALRPEVLVAWRQLARAIRKNMDPRRFELVTLAAARTIRSSYCCLAHGAILRDRFLGADQLLAVARDHREAGLDHAEVAAMEFAEKISGEAHRITPGDLEAMRAQGWSEEEIVDVALAAAARNFFARFLDAVGARPDAAYGQLEEPLRQSLTVGRGIEGGGDDQV